MSLVTSNEPRKITEIVKRLQRMSPQFFVVLPLPLLNANREPKKWGRRRNKFTEISKRIHRMSVSLGINIEHYL